MGKVLNKHISGIPQGAVYIGRGSAHGNPWPIGPNATRDEVCDAYEDKLRRDPDHVKRIRAEIADKDVVCFCKKAGASVRCHGDTIVGVATMAPEALSSWQAGKFSLRTYDANKEDVASFVARMPGGLSVQKVAGHDVGFGIPTPSGVRSRNVLWTPGANIAHDRTDLTVNTVNCVGVMGAGVALAMKNAYPRHYSEYRDDVQRGLLGPGDVRIYSRDGGGHIAVMATKDHWRDPSKIEWVEKGLENLAIRAKQIGVRSIGIPPPGCGNGGLDWAEVQPMVLYHLKDFDLTVYADEHSNPLPYRPVGLDVAKASELRSASAALSPATQLSLSEIMAARRNSSRGR